MTLRVQVKWVNAGSVLLPDHRAAIELSGGATQTRKGEGMREFEVPDGATSFDLTAQFSARFGPVTLASGTTVAAAEDVVWKAKQSYRVVNGTRIEPVEGFSSSGGHPLVETISVASIHGAAQILLRTDFVDVGAFWKRYAAGAGDYLAGRDPGARLAVLGHTGGAPLIWFASVPAQLATAPSAAVSCLVFYRPAGEEYVRLDPAHDMSRLNRYLLAQEPGSTGDRYPRCGFERAMVRSGRPVVMLHPWPSGEHFGEARGGKLPSLAARAVRFLWGSGLIDASGSQPEIHLGRLGLAAFGGGGHAMWHTLAAAGDRIEEVYAFDAAGILPATAIQWFGRSPATRCLRMTGAYQIAAHRAIKLAIEATSGRTSRVTAWPASAAAYSQGSTPAWDDALFQLRDADRGDARLRHQFAVFGGSGPPSGGAHETFLQEFLRGSDF